MRTEPIIGDVYMSRGSRWTFKDRAKPGNLWPEGTTEAVFYDSSGGILATLEGSVSPTEILYEIDPDDIADIPHGAGYEMFITPTDTGVPVMVRYGIVVRKQIFFPDAPPVDISETALYFGDDFNRTIVGPKWIVKQGNPAIANGSIGAAQQLFDINEKCALLFYAPLNGDDMTINVTFDVISGGKATMAFCCNYTMDSYLGFQVENAQVGGTDKVHIVKGSGPTTTTAVETVESTTTDEDNFVIKYNSQTDTVTVFKNDSGTALIEADGFDVPHGEGFRYLAMTFQTNAVLANGPRINEWSAKDGL